MHQYDEHPPTKFSPSTEAFFDDLKNSEYAVLVGKNNCGKSFILKTLTQRWGANTSYLGPARYQNFNLLSFFTPNRNRKQEKYRNFIDTFLRNQQNVDNSPINLQQAIAELSDNERTHLAEIVKILLNSNLESKHTVETNSMSQKYTSCGGHNLSFTSSGFRLITTLVTSLMDTDFDTFLIDEPELGISPEAQGILADFLFDRAHRAKYFPHIKTLIFATHSTIFLDRINPGNNYKVEKNGDEISVHKITTQQDFNKIHYFLLGNRLESLYLPSAIILVEGKCDQKFIERVLSLKYPNISMSIVGAGSDSKIKEYLNITKRLLSDFQKSPYKNRIIVVLDSIHSAGLPQELEIMGIPADNIVVWPKNGIEYYYPSAILNDLYGVITELTINGDDVSANSISYKKSELVDKIVSKINSSTVLHPAFESLFLAKIEKAITGAV